jgi:hypothetical protein
MNLRDAIAITVGTFIGVYAIYYFFDKEKPTDCGCEQRRVNILKLIGISS